MSTQSVEFWWALAIGTLVMLALAIAIIGSVVMSNKRLMSAREEKLRVVQKSERKYRTLVESMEDAVFVVDSAGKILFVNSRLAQFLRSTSDEIVGKTVQEVYPGKEGTVLVPSAEQVFSTGRTRRVEHQFEIDDVSYYFETTIVPQFDRKRDIVSVLGISRDITKRRKMEDQLMELVTTLKSQQETLKLLSSEVIRAQEAERKRIGRELHDEIGQALTAISLNLEMIKNRNKEQDATLNRRISDCEGLVEKTIEDIHRFSYELRPSILDDLGLLPAIRSHARSFKERTGISVNIQGTQSVEQLDAEMKTVLYRVLQEGLNNVVKHANANSIEIDLKKEERAISLTIVDDGSGFDPDELADIKPGSGGLGLRGIRERLELVGGNFNLESNLGSGTVLRVWIPYGEA